MRPSVSSEEFYTSPRFQAPSAIAVGTHGCAVWKKRPMETGHMPRPFSVRFHLGGGQGDAAAVGRHLGIVQALLWFANSLDALAGLVHPHDLPFVLGASQYVEKRAVLGYRRQAATGNDEEWVSRGLEPLQREGQRPDPFVVLQLADQR